MRYETGLFGGSMDPLHLGHLRAILYAASQCERLCVVLSYSRTRDSVPMEIRYRWLHNLTKHLDNVVIFPQEDRARTKEEFLREGGWERTRDEIVRFLSKAPDAVFCGSDYRGSGIYESLYPRAEILYLDRAVTDVSSSQIRSAPLRYWDLLPAEVRQHYVKTVLLVGGESTGKSTLARNLALYYSTVCVEEAGRRICEEAGGEDYMQAEDLQKCLLYQKTAVWEAKRQANRVLFVDTDALTTAFYIRFLLKDGDGRRRAEALADAVAGTNAFDLVLFLEPTVEFVQDGTRNERIAAEREACSEQLHALFERAGIRTVRVGGDYAERLSKAVKLTDEVLAHG